MIPWSVRFRTNPFEVSMKYHLHEDILYVIWFLAVQNSSTVTEGIFFFTVDNNWQFLQFTTILAIFYNVETITTSELLWTGRHFRKLRTSSCYNLSGLTIKSDTGQHLCFLWYFYNSLIKTYPRLQIQGFAFKSGKDTWSDYVFESFGENIESIRAEISKIYDS